MVDWSGSISVFPCSWSASGFILPLSCSLLPVSCFLLPVSVAVMAECSKVIDRWFLANYTRSGTVLRHPIMYANLCRPVCGKDGVAVGLQNIDSINVSYAPHGNAYTRTLHNLCPHKQRRHSCSSTRLYTILLISQVGSIINIHNTTLWNCNMMLPTTDAN